MAKGESRGQGKTPTKGGGGASSEASDEIKFKIPSLDNLPATKSDRFRQRISGKMPSQASSSSQVPGSSKVKTTARKTISNSKASQIPSPSKKSKVHEKSGNAAADNVAGKSLKAWPRRLEAERDTPLQCYGCDRWFVSYAGLIDHLSLSSVDENLNEARNGVSDSCYHMFFPSWPKSKRRQMVIRNLAINQRWFKNPKRFLELTLEKQQQERRVVGPLNTNKSGVSGSKERIGMPTKVNKQEAAKADSKHSPGNAGVTKNANKKMMEGGDGGWKSKLPAGTSVFVTNKK